MNTANFEWESVERGFNPRKKEAFVSIRINNLLINSNFFKQIDGFHNNYRYVRVRRSKANFCLLLEFLTPEEYSRLVQANKFTDGIFELLQDGGSKTSKRAGAFVINCGRLIKSTPWLKALALQVSSKQRRFEPVATEKDNAFIVQFIPSFEHEGPSHFCDVPADAKGIYCYVSADGEILYIGQGIIKSRFAAHRTEKDIPAKYFRYTFIEDEQRRLQAEAHHLDAFFAKHDRLPLYNRIAGLRTKTEERTV